VTVGNVAIMNLADSARVASGSVSEAVHVVHVVHFQRLVVTD